MDDPYKVLGAATGCVWVKEPDGAPARCGRRTVADRRQDGGLARERPEGWKAAEDRVGLAKTFKKRTSVTPAPTTQLGGLVKYCRTT